MEFTEKYYGKKLYYIPDTYDLSIIKEQRGYDPLFRDAEGKVFFELGGNKGYTSAYALTKGVKKIVSFEPEPLNIQYYKKNTEDGEDVTLYEGLGSLEDGTSTLYVNTGINHGLHSSVKRRGRKEVTVKSFNFWKILEETQPDLLKIDIEGGEYYLELETRKIPESVKRIAIEIDWKGWGDLKNPTKGKPYALYKSITEQFPIALHDTSKGWTQFNWSMVYIGERE